MYNSAISPSYKFYTDKYKSFKVTHTSWIVRSAGSVIVSFPLNTYLVKKEDPSFETLCLLRL
jgi:hypothetical protein